MAALLEGPIRRAFRGQVGRILLHSGWRERWGIWVRSRIVVGCGGAAPPRDISHISWDKVTHISTFFLVFKTYLFFADAARSLWRRFLNQLPTCVGVSPVAWAKCLFLDGLGYGSWRYHSLSKLRVLSWMRQSNMAHLGSHAYFKCLVYVKTFFFLLSVSVTHF